ncbi:MAG: LacI family DNA-binding transcriptional regulator [Caulobacteraceae bacterium]
MRVGAKAVTIKDVAAKAGVSIKTVSRVLNAEPYVTEAVKARVDAAIQELNFRPNASARSLPGAKSYLIALVFDDPASGYASAVQSGAVSRCRERGYHLVTEKISLQATDLQRQIMNMVQAVRLDGVILTPPLCDVPEILEGLEAAQVAYVRLSPDRDEDRSSLVYIDDQAAAFDMTMALIKMGHSQIGFIKGDPTHGASRRRFAGYLQALEASGTAFRPELACEGDFSFRSGHTAAQRLFGLTPSPTAIFASNDDMALGVLAAAGKAGIPVPEHLSVAGFDDSPGARIVWPQLTTIRQPNADMAAAAVDILVDQSTAKPGEARVRTLLDFQLMARETTAVRHR